MSDLPSLDALRATIPDHAKDIRLNLGSLASETVLSERQKWGTFLACALATGSAPVIRALEAEAAARLAPDEIAAVNTAAAIMAMNNVYYRSLHLMENAEYRSLRAGLRMNGLAGHGTDKVDFELWSLAVSAINGCGMCLDAHERTLRQHGVGATAVQAAIRIAAVVHSAAAVLRAEAARS